MKALRAVSGRYSALVHEIDPDYLSGDMAGYAEATEELEKLGGRLEALSRLAVKTEADNGDWQKVVDDAGVLDTDITALKATSAPLRAYSFAIRSRIKHPRWAIAQVKPAEFIAPPARAFAYSFTNTVKLEGQAGQEINFQLVAVPILKSIDGVSMDLPGKLKGRAGELSELALSGYFAITRSVPVEDDQREFPLCPYRLRPIEKGADIEGDLVLPCWFRMIIPDDAAPGVYMGSMEFEAHKVPDMELRMHLTVVDGGE
jgi:hypothetical protein